MRILKSFEAAGHGTEDDDEVHVEDHTGSRCHCKGSTWSKVLTKKLEMIRFEQPMVEKFLGFFVQAICGVCDSGLIGPSKQES